MRRGAPLPARDNPAMVTGTAVSDAFPLASRLDERGRLQVGGCDAIELAREFGTPAYVVAEEDLRAVLVELNLPLVVVTHDLGLVAEMCAEVMVLYGGTIAEYASSDPIFNDPRHPYTQRLLQAFPDIAEPGSELASIPGNPPPLDDLPPGCRFEPRCHVSQGEAICSQQHPMNIEISDGHRVACHLVMSETKSAK